MKDLAKKFLSEADKEKIRAAVQLSEGKSSGEIVPLVITASYSYPMADVIGAFALSFPPAILLTPFVGGHLWVGPQNMWIFIGLFGLFFWLFHELVKRIPWLKRLFISRKQIEDEVREAAVKRFFEEGLYRTRDETGVLIYISILERKVWVLADRGINEKVPPSRWDGIVTDIIIGIKEKRQADAISDAILEIGNVLATHFPKQLDDKNELVDLITD